VLQGCGGSSSSSEPEKPVEPVEYTFSLTSQLTNDCGVASAFTEVELLLQDDTWQTTETYQADENGVISFVTESEFINYTLVAKDQQGNDAQGLNVISYYQASSATPSHYKARFDESIDNASCECVTKDIQISHRTFAEPDNNTVTSSLSFTKSGPVGNKATLFEGVNVCRVTDGSWPLNSFSVSGTDINQKPISVAKFTDDYKSDEVDVLILAADEVPDSIPLVMPHQVLSTQQIIGNSKHFLTQVAKGDDGLLIFGTHSYISEAYYQTQASVTFDERDSVVRSSVVQTTHQVISTDIQTSLAVKANEQRPPIDDVGITEIKDDGSYDYSGVAGFPMAVISYTFLTFDPATKLVMPAKWTFYGPEEGTLAISAPLTGYTDIIDTDTRKEAINVRLINSMAGGNYSDYIKFYQGESTADMTDDFVKNMSEVQLNVKY
jgi:hypothetical protein